MHNNACVYVMLHSMNEGNFTFITSLNSQMSMSTEDAGDVVSGGDSQMQKGGTGSFDERERTIMNDVSFFLLLDLKTGIIYSPQMATILQTTGPVNMFRFIVNPNHFGQSVENMYYLSCLFCQGICRFKIVEDSEPIICECMSILEIYLLTFVRLM